MIRKLKGGAEWEPVDVEALQARGMQWRVRADRIATANPEKHAEHQHKADYYLAAARKFVGGYELYRAGSDDPFATLTEEEYERVTSDPETPWKVPQPSEDRVGSPDQTLWLFRDSFYLADDDLTAEDVKALILESENKRRLKLEKAHALMAMRAQLDQKGRREPIPQEVKLAVWQRDHGHCTECGGQQDLEFDHIIPLAMGGASTERNLQLLCAVCNRRKGATLG